MLVMTLPLSSPNATLETVGGKGMSLAKLARAGLPVPDGYHITTAAYRQFVAENGLQPRILEIIQGVDTSNPDSLDHAAEEISDLFAAATIPTAIASAISTAYAEVESAADAAPAVAVRSSATAEDLPSASFAGQQETFLNIRGANAVLDAVKKCWASLWTARAIAYRARQLIAPFSDDRDSLLEQVLPHRCAFFNSLAQVRLAQFPRCHVHNSHDP